MFLKINGGLKRVPQARSFRFLLFLRAADFSKRELIRFRCARATSVILSGWRKIRSSRRSPRRISQFERRRESGSFLFVFRGKMETTWAATGGHQIFV
jgi:hypothetical protein